MTTDTIIKIILPILAGFFSAIVTYYFTRKGKVDDETIKRSIEIAERLSITTQNIIEDEEYFYQLYERNYGHHQRMEEAVENFERKKSLYSNDYQRIQSLMEARKQASDDIKIGRLYLIVS